MKRGHELRIEQYGGYNYVNLNAKLLFPSGKGRGGSMAQSTEALARKLLRRGKTGDWEALVDCFGLLGELELEGSTTVVATVAKDADTIVYDPANFRAAHDVAAELRRAAGIAARSGGGSQMDDLYKDCSRFNAPYDFDVFCQFIEFDRPLKRQFYLPRRKQLRPLVTEMQRLEDGELEILGISLPPGVGKTETAIFYLCWLAGKYPDMQILGSSHNREFLRGVYDECLRIMDPRGEYLWHEVFPHLRVLSTNALDMRIDLGKRKRFETLEFGSVGSGLAGKVRATKLLYCDDLVESIEQAMSKERLDKLWNAYVTDLRQRRIGDQVKELHIATRWSLHDVIGRLEQMYEGNPKAEFIRVPALNEDDESNFDYPYGLGYTTQALHEQRDAMDDASWRALYMSEPIERAGVLYEPDELRRFWDVPEREPDAVLAVVDVADGGGDYWSMPIMEQYGNDIYVVDFLCDNGKPEVVEDRIVQKLVDHKVKICQFESNRGAGRVASAVQEKVKAKGWVCQITSKWNQTEKSTRIIVDSAPVKQKFLFRAEENYKHDKEYRQAMNMLTGYTMTGKNKHDDVPDSMSQALNFLTSSPTATVTIGKRPW